MKLHEEILKIDKEFSANALATLNQIGLMNMIWKKAQDIGSKKEATSNLEKAILQEKEKLKSQNTEEQLFWRLIFKINQILDIEPINYASTRDLHENCDNIEKAVIKLEKEGDKKLKIDDFEAFLQIKTKQIFADIFSKFKDNDISQEDNKKFIEQLEKFVNDLPDDQRQEIKKAIGTDEITISTLKKAIASGTLTSAFAILVNTGGFAFYTGAVSLLASLAGLLGITLPFAFYTFLTSLIAVLADPTFISAFLILGGGGLVASQNRKIEKNFISLTVAQIGLLGYNANAQLSNGDKFILYFENIYSAKMIILNEYNANTSQISFLNTEIIKAKDELEYAKKEVKKMNEQLDNISKLKWQKLNNYDYLNLLLDRDSKKKDLIEEIMKQKVIEEKPNKKWYEINFSFSVESKLKDLLKIIIEKKEHEFLLAGIIDDSEIREITTRYFIIGQNQVAIDKQNATIKKLETEISSLKKDNRAKDKMLKDKDEFLPNFSKLFEKQKAN